MDCVRNCAFGIRKSLEKPGPETIEFSLLDQHNAGSHVEDGSREPQPLSVEKPSMTTRRIFV